MQSTNYVKTQSGIGKVTRAITNLQRAKALIGGLPVKIQKIHYEKIKSILEVITQTEEKIKSIEALRSDLQKTWKEQYLNGLANEKLPQTKSQKENSYAQLRARIIDGISSGKITKEKGIELLKKAKAVSQ